MSYTGYITKVDSLLKCVRYFPKSQVPTALVGTSQRLDKAFFCGTAAGCSEDILGNFTFGKLPLGKCLWENT